MVIKSALLLTMALALSSCTSPGSKGKLRVGTITDKVSETEGKVFLKKNEVKVGDKIEAFYVDCGQRNNPIEKCRQAKLGEGTITKLIDDQASMVKFDKGVTFWKGAFVEKL